MGLAAEAEERGAGGEDGGVKRELTQQEKEDEINKLVGVLFAWFPLISSMSHASVRSVFCRSCCWRRVQPVLNAAAAKNLLLIALVGLIFKGDIVTPLQVRALSHF